MNPSEVKERLDAARTIPPAAEDASGRAPDPRGARQAGLHGDLWTAIALFSLTAVLILASRWISPSFGGLAQAKAILVLSSFIAVTAFGQQMVILTGGLDLSIASVMTMGGVLTFGWIGASGPALIWGIPLVLVLTAAIGALNGIGVVLLRVPPFIMTLAMGIIVYGAALGFTGGTPRGQPSPALSALFTGHVLGVPPVILLIAVFAALGTLLQLGTAFGRRLYAVGTNPAAAYIAGLPVRRLTLLAYAISGGSSGLAGILMVGYAGGATLTMGQGYQLPSIAAAVVGGTSILGGSGLYLGAVGGALLLTTFSTIISALGIAEGWRTILYGAVILLALLLLRDELYAWIGRAVTRPILPPDASARRNA
ncbi:MAG TPA: ABC transporter permease [Acetobacteraceae bacterium]|nr:ABC transporter permease [Acetobacteraceae bacterium]